MHISLEEAENSRHAMNDVATMTKPEKSGSSGRILLHTATTLAIRAQTFVRTYTESTTTDHNQLGNIDADADELERALSHYQESIRYKEEMGNVYNAGQTRYNVAAALAGAGRFEDALLYAQAALRNYETFGERAADKIQKTQSLIGRIEEKLQE